MRHHEDTTTAFADQQAHRPEVLGLIMVGSVARGEVHPDSDVDISLVVTEQAYDAAAGTGELAFVTSAGVDHWRRTSGRAVWAATAPSWPVPGGYLLLRRTGAATGSCCRTRRCTRCWPEVGVRWRSNGGSSRGQKYLSADLAGLDGLPAAFLPAWRATFERPTPAGAQGLITAADRWLGDPLTDDVALSTYIADKELAWLHQSIPPECR